MKWLLTKPIKYRNLNALHRNLNAIGSELQRNWIGTLTHCIGTLTQCIVIIKGGKRFEIKNRVCTYEWFFIDLQNIRWDKNVLSFFVTNCRTSATRKRAYFATFTYFGNDSVPRANDGRLLRISLVLLIAMLGWLELNDTSKARLILSGGWWSNGSSRSGIRWWVGRSMSRNAGSIRNRSGVPRVRRSVHTAAFPQVGVFLADVWIHGHCCFFSIVKMKMKRRVSNVKWWLDRKSWVLLYTSNL